MGAGECIIAESVYRSWDGVLGHSKVGDSRATGYWLTKLAAGQIIGAFALTEPEIGSDAKNIDTNAFSTRDAIGYRRPKKWISCGQIADFFPGVRYVRGLADRFSCGRNRPGLTMQPISGMLGFRSAMLSELEFNDCLIPSGKFLGKIGLVFRMWPTLP